VLLGTSRKAADFLGTERRLDALRRIPGLASGVAIVGSSACSRGSLVPDRRPPASAAAAAATARRRTARPPGTRALCDRAAGRRLRLAAGVPELSGVQAPAAAAAAAAMASMLEKPGAQMEAERPLLW
jgi:hypothetical protein